MILKLSIGVWLSLVILAAFLFPLVPVPEKWYEFPLIPALEERARILFFHVPMAWVSVVAFLFSMYHGIRYLRTRIFDEDLKAVAAAGLGLLFCILATVTGSVWAKFNWGSFWNWDPRQVSIFLLLLVYGAYFALRSAVEVAEKRATLSAVYGIIAGVSVPFFVFIMPRLVASLHPEPLLNAGGKIHMNAAMLAVFLSSLAGFTALFFWLMNLRVRLLRLEQHQSYQGD